MKLKDREFGALKTALKKNMTCLERAFSKREKRKTSIFVASGFRTTIKGIVINAAIKELKRLKGDKKLIDKLKVILKFD